MCLPAFDGIAATKSSATLQANVSRLPLALFAAHCNFFYFLKFQSGWRSPLHLPLQSPQFSPRLAEDSSRKWLNMPLFLGDLSILDLWLKWDKPEGPQVAGFHCGMMFLCLNCSDSNPGHLNSLKNYICINYGLS